MSEYNPMRDSTNGCALIAPLISIHHTRSGGPGISDDVIERMIDDEAPPILRQVRQKMGLRSEALIVPSDVHDYLVDEKFLKQNQFVGVFGGNILDTEHLSSFYNLLEGKESVSKMAATLFFREHVVRILKMTRSNEITRYWAVGGNSSAREILTRPFCFCSRRTRCRRRRRKRQIRKKYK